MGWEYRRHRELLRHAANHANCTFHHIKKHKIPYFLLLSVLIMLAVTWYCQKISAVSDNTSLMVSAIVNPNCLIEAPPTSVNFGTFYLTYWNETQASDASSGFRISCTKGSTALLSIGQGQHSVGITRNLSNGMGGYLAYDIYTTASRATVWNEKNIVRYDAKSTSPYSIIIFAYLAPGEYVKAGTYQDNVAVTVKFYPAEVIRTFSVLITIVFLPTDDVNTYNLASR